MGSRKPPGAARGRRPGDVLCPSVGLDIGPISGPDVEKARFDLLTAWLGSDFPLPDTDPDDHTQRDMLWEQRQRDKERLLEGGKHGEAVRIWYSNAPYSLCGFYDVLWQLRDCDCPVTVLEMPQWMPLGDDTVQSCLSWGDLSPGDWAAYLSLEREIPKISTELSPWSGPDFEMKMLPCVPLSMAVCTV